MTDNRNDHDILLEMRADQKTMMNEFAGFKKTLFGEDGRDGLVGDVAEVRRDVRLAKGIGATIATLVTGGGLTWLVTHFK